MKYALVTGANRGLGLGFCKVLVSRGYTVFAGMRNITLFSNELDNIIPVEMHVEKDRSIQNFCLKLSKENIKLDLLINNAGVNRRSESIDNPSGVSKIDNINRKDLLHMFNINSISPLVITSHCLPVMATDQCFIINISSGRASFSNESNNANYGYRASKVALNMFTKASVYDLPKNIQTFAVHPGLVMSDMNPDGDISPEEAAEKIMRITDKWSKSNNGAFLDNDGELFPL